MAGNRIEAALLAALWSGSLAAQGQGDPPDILSRDETALVLPTSASLAVWTDSPGYLRSRDLISAYFSADPNGDRRRFRMFLFLENIVTGRRMYLGGRGASRWLREEIVDSAGLGPEFREGARIASAPPARVWSGRLFESGLWQFVAEVRSPDTTEIVKRAHAKFVVSARVPAEIGSEAQVTRIAHDTTWTSDKIHSIRGQVFVSPGAVLTIEPGTLVLARGPQAAIVVEQGGRIMAEGRPDAPIVMTCEEAVGERFEGCWGGLVILGRAPTTHGAALGRSEAPGAVFGGEDPLDSSGTLRYVRVEFAGAGSVPGTQPAGLGFYGVGAGTSIDHVQSHASAGDGIRFVGGTANCRRCVSSGASDDGFEWARGWQGSAQYLFLQQGPGGGDCGIEGQDSGPGSGTAPRLYNLTIIGGAVRDPSGGADGCGIRLHTGASMKARNLIVTGFAPRATEVRDRIAASFRDGARSIAHAIVHASGGRKGDLLIGGDIEIGQAYLEEDPKLINVRYAANPDPRPKLSSAALKVGAGAVPPSDGFLDTGAQQIGAFSESNWLEEWTFFGRESDYRAAPLDETE